MTEETVNTSGSQDERAAKPASIVGLSSLATATAHILTALKSEEPSVSSVTSPSESTKISSSVQAENIQDQITEPVTKPKTKEKKMTTKNKKPKAEKKMTVARMLQRLDKVLTFKRLSLKMSRWLEDEKDETNRERLLDLKTAFDGFVGTQTLIRERVVALQEAGYVPPKKNFSGTMQLEHGRQVWVKPKFAAVYTVSMSKESLNNLFVDQVVGGNVVVSLGSPDDAVAMKFPVPKLRLQVTAPSA